MDPCSEIEKIEILREFKEEVSDLNPDETTCLRFLTAQDFDVASAKEMMRNTYAWRNESKVDEILDWEVPQYLERDFPFKILNGMSPDGCPVVWFWNGRWPSREYVEQGKKDEFFRLGLYRLETVLKKVCEGGKKKIIVIADLEGLSYYQLAHYETLQLNYTFCQTFELNYPEMVERFVLINAPWVYSIAYNFVYPILSTKTQARLEVYDSDKSKWLPVIRNICRDEIIPAEYLLGNNTNNDIGDS